MRPSAPRSGSGFGERVAARLPGLAVVAVAAGAAYATSLVAEALSPIVVGLALGVLLGNVATLPRAVEPGLGFAAKGLLRLGIVLVGFRLALGDLFALGAESLLVVLGVVAATLAFTLWLGSRLRVSRELSMLAATGYAICGATAVAAMREVVDADEDETAFAVALVTLFGTLSIIVLPLLAALLGLPEAALGQWVGAGVHDVGQVVAAASAAGPEALTVAVVVKLTRVLLLAPVIAVVALVWRNRPGDSAEPRQPPLVPLFIAGFVAAVAVRSSGLLPEAWVACLETAGTLALTAALVGLGTTVRLSRLRVAGGRGLLLGLLAWVFVAAVAYLGVLAVRGAG